jgi:very-short-patch-repair endonuclease
MSDIQQALESLRDIIAGVITSLEIWDTLHEVCQALGLPEEDTQGLGKAKYLRKVTASASDSAIIKAAKKMLSSYPGARSTPSEPDLQLIQDALWWIESQGVQRISNVTRYRIAESLEGIRFWGRLSLREFFAPVLPTILRNGLPEVGDDSSLYEGLSSLFFSTLFFGSQPKSERPSPISVIEFLQQHGLAEWPDERFCLLIECIVHPEVQPHDIQLQLVSQLNALLERDELTLRQEGAQGGFPVFKIRRTKVGVLGSPKYIIFASIGKKPDIVIDDAVNMDIRIVRYVDKCLVYDQPPPYGDLTWHMLVEWWREKKAATINDEDIRRDIGLRLRASLQSEPEFILFDTYFKVFKPIFGDSLPALLPQVYLHYDPRNRNERKKPALVRQRMDFLLLLRNAARIVIEIDGVQHYADHDGRASPQRYAEMVAEDRRIRGLGYEVYRFGGAEFKTTEYASKIIVNFFKELFDRYGIHPD